MPVPHAKRKEYMKAYHRRHYLANKQKYIDKARKVKKRNAEYIKKIKESLPCADCGKYYPSHVMDFDHLRDKKKAIANGSLFSTLKQIKDEIEKCELVCSNCHRVRTHNRRLPQE